LTDDLAGDPAGRVIATAGHVDHGKSTIVLTLTGTDPDRFEEEKRRGLTIDLGFAWAPLPSGARIAFVDVPGHVRFIKNMLAGVGSVDGCLFVVAATEGWKPQSEEHLRILELLGITHGVIALTQVDLVDADHTALARLDVGDHVAGTFLESAEVIEVAAPAGVGVDELLGALDRLVASAPGAVDRGRPRLWIDRVFAPRGAGTVVTGTLTGGALAVDDDIVIEPGHIAGRVRGLETFGESRARIGPGNRVAVNIAGVDHHALTRGMAVARPDQWRPARVFDAELTVIGDLGHTVSRRGAYVAAIGSGEHPTQLRVIGDDAIEPGGSGWVRLRVPEPVPLLPGDRFVLRESGRAETVGGGEIVEVAPVRPVSKARPDRSVDRVISERGPISPADLEALTGERRVPNLGRWIVAPEQVAALHTRLEREIAEAGLLGLDTATLNDVEREVLATVEGVVVDGGRARPAEQRDPLADHPYLAALRAAPFAPPGPDAEGVDRAELRELVRRELVVERDGVWFAAEAVDQAGSIVAGLLRATPDGITVAQLREALGTSRKYAMPLVAELDARGVTRRRGDLRIAGPRLPRAGEG
jgi:selenocysteine-specific elongation factor